MKPWKEVIDGIRNAVLGKEVREDLAQMGEYVEQFANTAGENIQKAIDPTLSVSGKAADAKETGDKIGQLKEGLVTLNDTALSKLSEFFGSDFDYSCTKVIDTTITENEYFNENTGKIETYKFWNRTDYIDISGYDYIGLEVEYRSNVNNTRCNIFFDSSMDYINNFSYKNGGKTIVVIPENAKYVSFSGDNKQITTDFKPYIFIGKIKEIDKTIKYVSENLKTLQFEIINNEYYSDKDGIVCSYNLWNRTNRIKINGAKTVTVETTHGNDATNLGCNVFYDKNGCFISNFTIENGREVEIEIPKDAYYMGLSASRLLINDSTIIRYTGDINKEESYYNELHSLSGYNTPASNCSYANPIGYKQNFTCAIITDVHGDVVKTNEWFDFIDCWKKFIDCGINLGDIVAKKINDDYTFFGKIVNLSTIPILSCIGNHDIGDPWNGTEGGSISLSEAYDRYIKPMVDKGWVSTAEVHWFKDISDYKIRLISLNQYCSDIKATSDVSEYMYSCYYSSEELKWLADTLYDTPDGYTVIILAHQFPSDSDEVEYVDNNFTISKKFPRTLRVQRTILSGTPIEDIINAYKTKGSVNQTYISNNSNLSNASVSKDFSTAKSNKYACMLTGHTHFPLVLKSKKYSDQIVIVCPSTSSDIYQRSTDDTLPMDENDKNFYVLSINTNLQLINILKIGNTKTQDMVDRITIAINY